MSVVADRDYDADDDDDGFLDIHYEPTLKKTF